MLNYLKVAILISFILAGSVFIWLFAQHQNSTTQVTPSLTATPYTSITAIPFTVTTTPTTSPSPTWLPGIHITTAFNGQTITMHQGDTFLIQLGSIFPNVKIQNQSIIKQISSSTNPNNQGVFEAIGTGKTMLTAVSHYPCEPKCLIADQVFTLTIVVLPNILY